MEEEETGKEVELTCPLPPRHPTVIPHHGDNSIELSRRALSDLLSRALHLLPTKTQAQPSQQDEGTRADELALELRRAQGRERGDGDEPAGSLHNLGIQTS